jgi:hopanoid biosynthesis associated RND transporter like protein HpnN
MSVPGTPNPPQVIVLEPVLDFDRLRPARAAMDALRQEADAITAANPAVRVRITGTVAMEDEELVSVTAGATLAGVLALLMVAVVLYTALRSVVLLVVTVATLLVGLMGTACFAAATLGHLNLISVAFAVLYIGLGVDFAIHWTLRFLELRRQGMTVERALPATAQGVGTSLIICAVTTAIGFYSFIPTPFSGVSELGFISGTGMFISLFVTVTLLPALLAILPGRVRQDGRGRGVAMIQPLVRHPRRVVLVAMCLGVVAVLLLPGVRFDNNPLNLRDPESESVLAFKAMLAGAAPPLSLFILAEPDDAEVQAQAAAALAAVRSVGTIADLVPVQQADKVFILEDLDLLLGPDFDSLEADPAASPEGLGRAFARLGATLAQLERPASLEQQLAARLAGLADANPAELISWQRRLTVGLPDELTRLADGLGAAPFDVEQLPEALTTRWRASDGRQLIEIVPATDISASRAAEAFVDVVRSVLPNATGLPVVHREAGRTVVTAFRLAFTYALVIIGALLWLLLQSAKDALLVLAPIVLGALLTGACSVVFGIPFNFANIIALPLLLGVGVDNGIHMVHRARTEPAAGGDALHTSTSAAVLFSGLTTLASFGNLSFSPHLGMASMGQLLAIGMALTLAATLILLPALLALRR